MLAFTKLIPFSLFFWIITSTNASKINNEEEVTTTVVDILSENVEFSSFLRLLQRNQLIPFLNEVDNITLVAPVNSAFVANCTTKDCKTVVKDFSLDDLKRYIIDVPLLADDFDGVRILKSFHKKGSPVLVDLDQKEHSFLINTLHVVEQDLIADSQDSVVQGIEKLFDAPKSTIETLERIPSVSILQKFLQNIYEIENQTLLVPRDHSFKLKDYELNYLYSDYGSTDALYIINSLILNGTYGGDINENIVDNNGFEMSITSKDKGAHISINDSIISDQSNILSESSIIHIFDDNSLIPKIEFNPLKVMIGLNSSQLVDELLLQKLSSLITNNSISQTIFIPTDPNQFTIASKNSNLYHFVDEKIKDLTSSKTLYNSKFCNSKKLGQQCQRIKVEENDKNQILLNDNIIVEKGPFKVGETLIYLTDEDLRTPNEISSSIRPVLHCSTSLKMMQKSGLLKLSNNGLGYTFFLPCYDAWDDFELTMNYFETNKTALDELMKNFVLNGLIYTDLKTEKTELTNMNGEKVLITNKNKNNDDEKLSLKYNHIDICLTKNDDILFNQGVVHPIETLFFPENVDISLQKIISSSDSELFLKFASFFPEIESALNLKNYSILLPSHASLEKIGSFDSNTTLEKFLKLHIIHPSSLKSLYDCSSNSGIQTLAENINLTCSKISGHRDTFLQIDGGADNGVRILSRGCTDSESYNCVFAIDRPISLSWLDNHQHYHLNLPGVALAIGVMMGIVVMIFVFVCLMLFVARKKKSFMTGVEQGDANNNESTENDPLLAEQNGVQYTGNDEERNGRTNFENQYSNTFVNPISVSSKRSNQNNVQIG